MNNIQKHTKALISELKSLKTQELVEALNQIKTELHRVSPFSNEPVDCVLWKKSELVTANDYNPNSVAPPEMKLLELSISEDGYTQPIVTWDNKSTIEVIDGFHRHRVGKEVDSINRRIHDYLPIVITNKDRSDRNDRIAATIRHNRARGKHSVDGMSEIVVELKKRNWSDKKISKELGMDQDEVLRLTQITGLVEMFKDKEFSLAWEAETLNEDDYVKNTDALD